MKTKEEECIDSIMDVTQDDLRTESEIRVALHYILSDYVDRFAKLHHNIRHTSLKHEVADRMAELYLSYGMYSDRTMTID